MRSGARRGGGEDRLRLVQWTDLREPEQKIFDELPVMGFAAGDDELAFEVFFGGQRYKDFDLGFFWSKF